MMEKVQEFLESSSIHGLSYVASSKRCLRLFWLIVVFSCFLISGSLIRRSVLSWENTPVVTTIETLPITEASFPLVTVCPPRRSYTNLNYDLMSMENARLDNQTRSRLIRHAVKLINDAIFERDLDLMKVESGLSNWYRGYDRIFLPQKPRVNNMTSYMLYSYASSGSVMTVGFKKDFDAAKFPLEITNKVYIYLPKEIQYVDNASITLRIEHDTNDKENIRLNNKKLDLSQAEPLELVLPVSYCGRLCIVKFYREMEPEYFEGWKLKRMTGMKVSWHYNTSVESQSFYLDKNKNFIRMVNIIHKAQPGSVAKMWDFIKEIKASWSLDVAIEDALFWNEISAENMLKTLPISNYLRDLEIEFNLTNISQEPMPDEIKEETYKTASDMFLYLAVYPPRYKWVGWMALYKDLLQTYSPKKIVTTLAGISSNSEEIELSIFLNQMSDILNMTYKKIESVIVRKTDPQEEKDDLFDKSGTNILTPQAGFIKLSRYKAARRSDQPPCPHC